jgi:preprotein translocase subunit YajC
MKFISQLLASTAYAQGAAAPAGPSTLEVLVMPMGFLLIMYFLMIKPQQKKAKEQAEMIKNLKVGDEIVTSGGIIGKIRTVADAFVTMESNNSSLRILKTHISSYAKAEGNVAPLKK